MSERRGGRIGCAIIVLGPIALLSVYMAVTLIGVRTSGVYRQTRDRAMADPRVVAAVGAPIHDRWLVTGDVDAKTATLDFRLIGSRDKATAHADAAFQRGAWTYSRLVVRADQGAEIDVLHGR